jgi:hypothetical protein
LLIFVVVAPRRVFVIKRSSFKATMQDADQTIAQLSQCRLMPATASAELVVISPGTW